eukprot:4845217-Alexandrium_andersonii.AAC.1
MCSRHSVSCAAPSSNFSNALSGRTGFSSTQEQILSEGPWDASALCGLPASSAGPASGREFHHWERG